MRGSKPPRYTPAEDAPAPVLTATARTQTIAPEQPKTTRAERRRKQRKQRRRRRVSAVGIVAIVGALIAAFVVVRLASSTGDKEPDVQVRTQSTLLFQIRAADGKAAASALLAHDSRTKQGVILLVPSRVIAAIPGRGSAPFANALATGASGLSQATLTDLIGVTVDGGIVVDQATFARLVDGVGGITVDVDTDVRRVTRNGPTIVLVPAGNGQKLDGASAAAYATYGTGDQAQLVRVQRVLQGILAKIETPADFTKALTPLGKSVQLTMPATRVSEIIAGLAGDDRSGKIDIQSLDVRAVDTGSSTPTFIIDAPAVKEFVKGSLAASVPEGLLSGSNRVLVKNGIGTPQLGASTRARLLTAGFVYVDGGNVPGFPFKARNSAVLIFNATQASRERGTKVAAALGLPAGDVQISTIGQSVADVIVVLGRDYKR